MTRVFELDRPRVGEDFPPLVQEDGLEHPVAETQTSITGTSSSDSRSWIEAIAGRCDRVP